MKEERIKRLRKELDYLLDSEIEKELVAYDVVLSNDDADVLGIAKEIYTKRGFDYSKIKKNFFEKLIDTINEFAYLFKNKKSNIRNKMIVEVITMVLILVLLKIPFDLVRDIGYDYIKVISDSMVLYNLWYLAFLLIYTIVFICTFIVLIRNFNNKYRKM